MHLVNDTTFFNLNLGQNIINLTNTSDSVDTEYSENPNNLSFISKSYNFPDQEKGSSEKELQSKNESAALLIKNENLENSENKKILKKNFEIEEKNENQNLQKTSSATNKLKHYGNIMPLIFNKQGEPIMVIGPHCKINLINFLI